MRGDDDLQEGMFIAGRHLSGEPEFLQQYPEEKDQYMALLAKHGQLKEVAQ